MNGCRPLTIEEIQQTLENFRGVFATRNRALFMLGICTGFRISELLSMKVGDLVDIDGELQSHVTVGKKDMKKKLRSRTVLLAPEYEGFLWPWITQIRKWRLVKSRNHLFCKYDGQPISRIVAYRVLKRAYKAAGIKGKVATHSMRKTYARNAFEEHKKTDPGNALRLTKESLGHAQLSSTESYLEIDTDQVEIGVRAFHERLFSQLGQC